MDTGFLFLVYTGITSGFGLGIELIKQSKRIQGILTMIISTFLYIAYWRNAWFY